jgi:hypothetical protein
MDIHHTAGAVSVLLLASCCRANVVVSPVARVSMPTQAGGLARGLPCSVCTLRLRGGRVREEQVRWDEENEKLALDYMSRLKHKGQQSSLDLNAEEDDRAEIIGVPQQVADEEAESKRRSRIYPRSTLWQTTRRTALCIQLSDALWKKVNKFRVHHDGDYDKWYMPVIKLSHLFFTAEKLWEASDMVQQCVRDIPPFNISFGSLRVVSHGSESSLWLEPDGESRDRILHVRTQLMERFPTLLDKVQHGDDGALPHVKLGNFADAKSAEAFRDVLLAEGGWTNMSFLATDVSVCTRSGLIDTEPFDTYRTCPFGGGVAGRDILDMLDEEVFAEAEGNLERPNLHAAPGSGHGGGVDPLDAVSAGVVQQWNTTTKCFEVISGLDDHAQVRERRERLQEQVRARKLDKSDTMARDFLNLPSRFHEQLRARIPALVVERLRRLSFLFFPSLFSQPL